MHLFFYNDIHDLSLTCFTFEDSSFIFPVQLAYGSPSKQGKEKNKFIPESLGKTVELDLFIYYKVPAA